MKGWIMRRILNCDIRKFLDKRKRTCTELFKKEDGSLATTSAVLLPMMLVVGGMSVDFMRFESERILLQDTADRAALAAANLEFTEQGAGKELVRDFFATANLEQYLDGDPIITETINSRTVEVNATNTINTFFLKLIGIDKLNAGARSIATQGVGNVEISLVLDISGSMGWATYDADGNATGETKMVALRRAATTFINTALQDSNKDRVSVSLVPYATHVNAGPDLFAGLNVTQRHNFSHCVNFSDDDFDVAGFGAGPYEQSQHIDRWSTGSSMNSPMCPTGTHEKITPLSQDRDALNTQIANLVPTNNTSIFMGMKWGLALLDPSAQSLVAADIDAAFTGRPAAFGGSGTEVDTVKVIVVMTDGQNTNTEELVDAYYSDDNLIQHFGTNPIKYWVNNNASSSLEYDDLVETKYNSAKGDELLQKSCDAANANGVQVFAIAFEAPDAGVTAMANCASSVNHFFNSNGDDLESVFRAIAEQVTDLRLTQ